MEINQTGEVCPLPDAEFNTLIDRTVTAIHVGMRKSEQLYDELGRTHVEIGKSTGALDVAIKELGPENPKTLRATKRVRKVLAKWCDTAGAFDEAVTNLRENIIEAKDEFLRVGLDRSKEVITILDDTLAGVDRDLMPMVRDGRRAACRTLAESHPDPAQRKEASDQLFLMDTADYVKASASNPDPSGLIERSTKLIERFENDPEWADQRGRELLSEVRAARDAMKASMEQEAAA